MTRSISFDVREEGGMIVLAVTFPLPPLGLRKTVDVRVTDDAARHLVARLEAILATRAKRLPR